MSFTLILSPACHPLAAAIAATVPPRGNGRITAPLMWCRKTNTSSLPHRDSEEGNPVSYHSLDSDVAAVFLSGW